MHKKVFSLTEREREERGKRERQKKVKEDHQVFVRRVRWSMYPNLMSVYYMCMYVIEKRRDLYEFVYGVMCYSFVLSVQNCRLSR